MSVQYFSPKTYFNTIGSHHPVFTIREGEQISTSTVDAHGMDKNGVKAAEKGNPMTGPFYVEEAKVGDVLAVHFNKIYPNRNWGWTFNTVADHIVDPGFAKQLPNREILRWDLDLQKGSAQVSKGSFSSPKLPFTPFLGCFGVAPGLGQAISTETSGNYGGNMDYRGFVAGTTVYLPVFVEGALLHLGDGHALQGDGEIVGTGIEVSMDVQFSVKLIKNKEIHWPRGETATHLFTVGNTRPLDQAIQHATTEMLHWLSEDYKLSIAEASTLLGQCVEYDVANIYNPAYTMVCKVNKEILTK